MPTRRRDSLPGNSTSTHSSLPGGRPGRPLHSLQETKQILGLWLTWAQPPYPITAAVFMGMRGDRAQAKARQHKHKTQHTHTHTHTSTRTKHKHRHTRTRTRPQRHLKGNPTNLNQRVSPTRGLGLPRLGRPSSGKPLATLPLPKGTWLRGLRRQKLQKLDTGPVGQRGTPPPRRPKKAQASLNTTLTTPSMRRYAGKVRNT